MPRQADKIFLRLATQKGYLQERDADDLWAELTRLEAAGAATKARKLAVEFGFMDADLAKSVKHEVREFLTQKVREESQQSRSQRRIAGFELLERLGSGAMGSVYKARHLRLNKTVAVKLLNPEFANDEKYVARFLLEARAAASMNHPNVVQAYDVGQAGTVHFIAMEYVEGKTVKELIDRRGKLDEAASIEIVIQILGALQHAHESNIVHRDVKPANLMITPDGQAKLLDLGLARRTDVENGLTGEGKAIGTPYFMAPEQALDKGADFRADIYALGGTLFNMVTGDKPYKARTPVGVMSKHLKAPIPDASKVCPEVSTGLARVIKKMLAKRPADRYQSHENLVNDLEAVLSGFMPELKTGKAPAGISYIQPRSAAAGENTRSRSRMGAGAGGFGKLQTGIAAAVVLLVAGALFLGSGSSAPPPVDTDDEPKAEVATRTKEKTSERAARALFDELTQGENWQRVEELEAFAKSYEGTKVARKARVEARRLREKLSTREERRFGSRRGELDAMAARGDLQEALEGYQALEGQIEDGQLRGVAKERAGDLEGVIQRRLEQLEKEAEGLIGEGRQREAAAVLRKTARLRPKTDRTKALARAETLDREASKRSAGARESAKKAREKESKSDSELVEDLPGQIAEHVRVDEVGEALALAKDVLSRLTTAKAKASVKPHIDALEAAARLPTLALEGFAQRKGTQISVARRGGGSTVEGELLDASGEKLKVALTKPKGATVMVRLSDLDEKELWRSVRKLMGSKSRDYLVGVTAIKLYRGDADATSFSEKCTAEGFDLGPVATALEAIKPDEGVEVTLAAGSGKDGETEDEREKFKRALERNKNERWLISQRLRLFPEADDVGYERGRLEPIYGFQDNQNFKSEWKRVRGKSRPTPPGAMERVGLILEGDGRAEFFAPLSGDIAIKVRFQSQMFDPNAGRFAITLDGEKGQQISCEMGQIVYKVKGKRRAIQGKSQASAVRTGTRNVLELVLVGKTLTSKFNGSIVTEVNLEKLELGTYKLGLEWNRAALNLTRIRSMLSPRPEWVERVVGKPARR